MKYPSMNHQDANIFQGKIAPLVQQNMRGDGSAAVSLINNGCLNQQSDMNLTVFTLSGAVLDSQEEYSLKVHSYMATHCNEEEHTGDVFVETSNCNLMQYFHCQCAPTFCLWTHYTHYKRPWKLLEYKKYKILHMAFSKEPFLNHVFVLFVNIIWMCVLSDWQRLVLLWNTSYPLFFLATRPVLSPATATLSYPLFLILFVAFSRLLWSDYSIQSCFVIWASTFRFYYAEERYVILKHGLVGRSGGGGRLQRYTDYARISSRLSYRGGALRLLLDCTILSERGKWCMVRWLGCSCFCLS